MHLSYGNPKENGVFSWSPLKSTIPELWALLLSQSFKVRDFYSYLGTFAIYILHIQANNWPAIYRKYQRKAIANMNSERRFFRSCLTFSTDFLHIKNQIIINGSIPTDFCKINTDKTMIITNGCDLKTGKVRLFWCLPLIFFRSCGF